MNIDIDIDRIFEERAGGVNDAGEVLATTMERIMQPYVPMSEGAAAHLVQRVQIVRLGEGRAEIIYPGPYAHYVYVGEVYGPNPEKEPGVRRSRKGEKKSPTGREMKYTGAPMRGKEWDKRAWQERSREVLEALANRMGGKVK